MTSKNLGWIAVVVLAAFGIYYFVPRGELTQQNVQALLDENDSAFAAGDLERECDLRTGDFVAREAIIPDHTRQSRTVDQISLYESKVYGDLDVMSFGSPASFRERSRREYCEPDPEWAAVVAHVRVLRTDLEVEIDEGRREAGYRSRYVMLRPQVLDGEVDPEKPVMLYITNEAGTVALDGGQPRISSTRTVTRIHWLAEGELSPDDPLPEFR